MQPATRMHIKFATALQAFIKSITLEQLQRLSRRVNWDVADLHWIVLTSSKRWQLGRPATVLK